MKLTGIRVNEYNVHGIRIVSTIDPELISSVLPTLFIERTYTIRIHGNELDTISEMVNGDLRI